jgi:hypothetical protein
MLNPEEAKDHEGEEVKDIRNNDGPGYREEVRPTTASIGGGKANNREEAVFGII